MNSLDLWLELDMIAYFLVHILHLMHVSIFYLHLHYALALIQFV
jgi:hypothetical protein